MRIPSLILPLSLSFSLVACGTAEKPEPYTPDYGDESLDGKADSAHAPASTVDVKVGDITTASFTSSSQYRAFRFDGKKGQRVTIYVDGLKGLDTVALLYRVSPTTRKPYGPALVKNDDTRQDGWTVRTNTVHNELSSSIVDFWLPETRSYAVVVTPYDSNTGKAEVVVKSAVPVDQQCSGLIAYPRCPTGLYCELAAGACHGADVPGYCKPRPQVCIQIYQPVCGCDGKTYGNDCLRQGAGVQLDRAGLCTAQLDDAARTHVYGTAAGQRIFASEVEASDYAQAHPTGDTWLARDGETTTALSYISGFDDLWAQRFDVDKLSGEVTLTGEH